MVRSEFCEEVGLEVGLGFFFAWVLFTDFAFLTFELNAKRIPMNVTVDALVLQEASRVNSVPVANARTSAAFDAKQSESERESLSMRANQSPRALHCPPPPPDPISPRSTPPSAR